MFIQDHNFFISYIQKESNLHKEHSKVQIALVLYV